MSKIWHGWMRTLGLAAVWSGWAVASYSADCAIALLALMTPYSLSEAQQRTNDPDEARVLFLRRVLGDTEDVWDDIFRAAGKRYEKPTLVLFTGATYSACGDANAVTGPFYCPLDRKIYLDLSFFDALEREYHAPGNFAQAYVIAHEVGHHVQTMLGVEYKVQAIQARSDPRGVNKLSVRVELQADCLAGVWASLVRQRPSVRLSAENIEVALSTTDALASAIWEELGSGKGDL